MKNIRYRSYRRMTDEEQARTGLPTHKECMKLGVSPPELVLGYDPFIVSVDRTWDELSLKERNSLAGVRNEMD